MNVEQAEQQLLAAWQQTLQEHREARDRAMDRLEKQIPDGRAVVFYCSDMGMLPSVQLFACDPDFDPSSSETLGYLLTLKSEKADAAIDDLEEARSLAFDQAFAAWVLTCEGEAPEPVHWHDPATWRALIDLTWAWLDQGWKRRRPAIFEVGSDGDLRLPL